LYDLADPRASLASAGSALPEATEYAGAEYGRFDRDPPVDAGPQGRSWYLRAQNFILNHVEAEAGGRFDRVCQPDEYALILPDPDMAVEVRCGVETIEVGGGSVAFVPAGDSSILAMRAGRIVRLITCLSADLLAKCSNAQSYKTAHPNIPPFKPWPASPSGSRIRTYPLEVAPMPGRFGSIHRCSTFMINAIERYEGPRDARRLSPHQHDDFEQCSFAAEGSFIHYVRWPWTPNLEQWRDDEHEHCASPSAIVIPPRAIHTSRGMSLGMNRLIDIFCPPRIDFSMKPGWVLNAADYPMPVES
jgi:hypothetical protein